MKKRTKLLGTAMALMLMATVVGCSNDEPVKEKAEKTTEEVAKKEKSDSELAKEIGKAEKPLFTEIKKEDLTKEQQEKLVYYKNAKGVNHFEDNIFLIVPERDLYKVRYITEVQEDDVIKVYLKKVSPKEEGSEMIIGKVDGYDATKKGNKEVWWMDAEENGIIQLAKADEKENDSTKETEQKKDKSSEKKDDKK